MIQRSGSFGERRAVIAATIIAAHVVVFVIMAERSPVVTVRRDATALQIVAIPLPAPAPLPPQAEVPLKVVVTAPLIDVDRPVEPMAAGCDLLANVSHAAQADAATVAALAPLATGSSPAFMAWNGKWSDAPAAAPLREVVAVALRGSPEVCLDEPLTGPRLIFVTVGGGESLSVAIGSGQWRWHDTLSPD